MVLPEFDGDRSVVIRSRCKNSRWLISRNIFRAPKCTESPVIFCRHVSRKFFAHTSDCSARPDGSNVHIIIIEFRREVHCGALSCQSGLRVPKARLSAISYLVQNCQSENSFGGIVHDSVRHSCIVKMNISKRIDQWKPFRSHSTAEPASSKVFQVDTSLCPGPGPIKQMAPQVALQVAW